MVTDATLVAKFEQFLGPQSVSISLLRGTQKVVPNKRPGEPAKLLQMSMALFRFKA